MCIYIYICFFSDIYIYFKIIRFIYSNNSRWTISPTGHIQTKLKSFWKDIEGSSYYCHWRHWIESSKKQSRWLAKYSDQLPNLLHNDKSTNVSNIASYWLFLLGFWGNPWNTQKWFPSFPILHNVEKKSPSKLGQATWDRKLSNFCFPDISFMSFTAMQRAWL